MYACGHLNLYFFFLNNFLLIFLANMSGVSKIQAREIFDSRGNPTVEVDITTSKGEEDVAQTPGRGAGNLLCGCNECVAERGMVWENPKS